MGKRWWVLAICSCLVVLSGARELPRKEKEQIPAYNSTLAKILVRYASAVYMTDLADLFTWTCSRCDGVTEGFEVIELVVDVEHCLQAFVGVAKNLNAIVVAFKGTQENSIQNWIEDLFWKQLQIKYPDMPDAMVHRGFYSGYHNTTLHPAIVGAVNRAKKFYGENINIMVTGHSMGGAMAAFCALDLVVTTSKPFPQVNYNAQNVLVMTFGQPRIGNAVFASYYANLVPNTFRITNGHDIVPHLPPYYSYFPHKTYHHFAREVWLHNVGFGSATYGVEKVCDGSGEDPSCSRSVWGYSVSDHLEYYGAQMGGDETVSCKIVMAPRVAHYGLKDHRGNFVLSRDPTVPHLELKSTTDYKKHPL